MPKKPAASGVYAIEDYSSGDVYVGSTRNLRIRWNTINNGKKLKVSHHMRNNPSHVIGMRILEEIFDAQLLKDREQFYIDLLKPTLNVSRRSTCDYPKHGKGVRGTENWHSTPVTEIRISSGEQVNYLSVLEAARARNVARQHVSRILRGRAKSSNGFTWKYTNKPNKAYAKNRCK